MPALAAMPRRRAPGSRAMHSGTRARPVRKLQLAIPGNLPQFLEIYC
jgi:hypothetical protein